MKYFIIIFIICLFFSCKKENPNPGSSIIYLSADLCKLKFKTGTFWVFVDSVNNNIDSQYVTSYLESWTVIPKEPTKLEYYTFTVNSAPSGFSNDYVISPGTMKVGTNDPLGNGIDIYYDYNENLPSYFDTIVIRYDSLYIYNGYYKNVEKTIIPAYWYDDYKKNIYYISSEYGFLKHEVYDTLNNLILNEVLINKKIIR